MALYDISEPDESESDLVRVLDTEVGKGVFSVRVYPATAVIGQITGTLMEDTVPGSEYTFEFDEGLQLEPDPPFRFLNHSCDPNCEFDLLEVPSLNGEPPRICLFLVALRDIRIHEQLTINYNWSAESAIPCECGSESCVGWVVCRDELERVHLCFAYPEYELTELTELTDPTCRTQ